MPIYLMECKKEHQWDQYFEMNEKKKEGLCPTCGKMGKRIFTPPNTSIDAKVSPWDIDGLTRKTDNMKGNIGNLWDLAAEASAKRGGDNDPIKKEALKKYAKERNGAKYRGKRPKTIDIQFGTGK